MTGTLSCEPDLEAMAARLRPLRSCRTRLI